jgi:N-carbamoyl-L-amino-acid hydrolase
MTFDLMWSAIAPIGRDGASGGYRRFAWSREDSDMREWFAGESERRGLDLTTDRAGNQWAWWGDPDTAVTAGRPGVAIGSHLDSVPDGGAFDGPLGVVSAFAAIDVLRGNDFVPTRPICVVNFADEEGARFGVACAGSRIITGQLDADRARGLTDAAGVSMAEALLASGRDPGDLGRDAQTLGRVGTFVELHVEQGRALIDTGDPLAIGTGLWPHGRWRIDFPGEANHAGTTRLADRRDAMIGYAHTVLAARSAAAHRGCLATIGKVSVRPGGVNAIASTVTGWLDARGADQSAVQAAVRDITAVAAEHGATVRQESWTPPTSFDPGLASRLQQILRTDVPLLGTGAGHDAGILAGAGIPTAMLFVRNPTGISHSPAEHAERDDCLAGVRALARVTQELAG